MTARISVLLFQVEKRAWKLWVENFFNGATFFLGPERD